MYPLKIIKIEKNKFFNSIHKSHHGSFKISKESSYSAEFLLVPVWILLNRRPWESWYIPSPNPLQQSCRCHRTQLISTLYKLVPAVAAITNLRPPPPFVKAPVNSQSLGPKNKREVSFFFEVCSTVNDCPDDWNSNDRAPTTTMEWDKRHGAQSQIVIQSFPHRIL